MNGSIDRETADEKSQGLTTPQALTARGVAQQGDGGLRIACEGATEHPRSLEGKVNAGGLLPGEEEPGFLPLDDEEVFLLRVRRNEVLAGGELPKRARTEFTSARRDRDGNGIFLRPGPEFRQSEPLHRQAGGRRFTD